MWITESDDWRDESTEGPIDTLKTKDGWKIVRPLYPDREDDKFVLKQDGKLVGRFDTIAAAKRHVEEVA